MKAKLPEMARLNDVDNLISKSNLKGNKYILHYYKQPKFKCITNIKNIQYKKLYCVFFFSTKIILALFSINLFHMCYGLIWNLLETSIQWFGMPIFIIHSLTSGCSKFVNILSIHSQCVTAKQWLVDQN